MRSPTWNRRLPRREITIPNHTTLPKAAIVSAKARQFINRILAKWKSVGAIQHLQDKAADDAPTEVLLEFIDEQSMVTTGYRAQFHLRTDLGCEKWDRDEESLLLRNFLGQPHCVITKTFFVEPQDGALTEICDYESRHNLNISTDNSMLHQLSSARADPFTQRSSTATRDSDVHIPPSTPLPLE